MCVWRWHQESGEDVLHLEYGFFFPQSQIMPPCHPHLRISHGRAPQCQREVLNLKLENKAGKMTRPGRCLPHKHGDLGKSNPKKTCKKKKKKNTRYNPSSKKTKTGRSLELSGQPAQPNKQVPCKSEKLSWKTVRQRVTEECIFPWSLAFTYMYTHVRSSMCIYVHVSSFQVYFKNLWLYFKSILSKTIWVT